MNNTLTPLYPQTMLPKIGGFRRLRIAYSKDIFQQELQTRNELESIIFVGYENWLGIWEFADDFQGDLKIEQTYSEYRSEEKHNFKAVLEIDADPQEFAFWFESYVKGRKLVLEITNNNGFVRRLNPYFLSYTYIGDGSFSQSNRYELSFTKATLSEKPFSFIREVIKNGVVWPHNTLGLQNKLQATVLLNYPSECYDILTGNNANIDEANLSDTNDLLLDGFGEYYIFVRRKGTNFYNYEFIDYNITNSYTDLILS